MTGSLVVVAVALLASVLGGRIWLQRRWVRQALAWSAEGDNDRARVRWARVARAWWATGRARGAALLDLGLSWLEDGDVNEAERWLVQVRRPPFLARARIARAAIAIATGRLGDAEALIGASMSDPDTRRFSSELDGVRLLWVYRATGAVAARELLSRIGAAQGALVDVVAWLTGTAPPPSAEVRRRLRWLVPEL